MSERKWTPPSWQSWEYHSGYYQALYDSAAPELYEANQGAIDSLEFAVRELIHRGLIPQDDADLMQERLNALKFAAAKARGEQ